MAIGTVDRGAKDGIRDFPFFNIIGQVVLPIKFCLSGIMGSFAEDVDIKEGDTGDSARVLYHAGVEVALGLKRYA